MSRRGGLAILMRARMRAASDPNTIVAEAQSRGPAELNDGSRLSSPPASAAPGNSYGNESVSSAALIKDAKGWMRASISMDRKLTDTADTALREFLKAYSSLSSEGRREILHVLVQDYDVDRVRVRYLMQQYLSLTVPCSDEADDQQQLDSFEESSTHSVFYRIERNLRDSLKPLYAIFFEQVNAQPGGLKLLVDLRADLLSLLEEENIASIRALDLLLKEKLATWLSPATLELRQITWDDPASLLEKIVAYEAVHPIINLLDLKRRLSVGRRCFGYLHPAIPGEPLIFIEVALLKDVAKSIEEVLWDSPPIPEPEATCALFYSISSTQLGLSGINLGKFLIKRAIKLLVKEMPHVSTFATLSPVPGYMQWLMSKLVYHSKLSESVAVGMSEDASNLTENILHPVEERQILDACLGHTTGRNGMEVMEKLLASPTYEWARNDELLLALKPPLLRLCARYLLKEKKRGKALDTVANFHLQNGAMIERINWMSDKSEKGLRQSGGIMVNYIYRLDKIKENAQAYSKMGDIQASINFSSYQDSR